MSRAPASDDALPGRDELLAAALPHIAFDGWSMAALEAGARDLGAGEDAVRAVFPRGARQALARFSRWADREMTAAFEQIDTSDLRMHEKIMLCVELRLNALGPHREAVRRGLTLLALPTNAALGARLLYRTVDDIWYAAGDRSADFSFYTKRGLLAGVVASTTLYWLDDRSEDFDDTHDFLERRIADVMRLYKIRRSAESLGVRAPNPVRALRDVLRRRYRFGDSRVT